MRIKGLKIHRITSWLITLFALITIYFGYAVTRRWFPSYDILLFLHLLTGWIFPSLLVVHFVFSIRYMKMKWRRIRAMLKKNKKSSTIILRLFQKITKWGIIVMGSLISLTGLSYYPWFDTVFGLILAFSIHIDFDIILSIFMIVHVAIGARFYLTRKRIKHWGANLSIVSLMISLTLMVIIVDLPPEIGGSEIQIGGRIYHYNPNEINSVRPELFQNDSFSVFDILVHLNTTGKISLHSHFNASMDTHVIDSINGNSDYWWYHIYYSGGHVEYNMERIDHYPWKLGAYIILYHESESYINTVYSRFTKEVSRYTSNNNSIIVPRVFIYGDSFNLEFSNLTLIPHNLRPELFKSGVITAMDVIETLGDLGNISYELTWIPKLGNSYVHSFFVTRINTDEAAGRWGFMYMVSDSFIFLSADERILTSPDNVTFFWGSL